MALDILFYYINCILHIRTYPCGLCIDLLLSHPGWLCRRVRTSLFFLFFSFVSWGTPPLKLYICSTFFIFQVDLPKFKIKKKTFEIDSLIPMPKSYPQIETTSHFQCQLSPHIFVPTSQAHSILHITARGKYEKTMLPTHTSR